MRISAAAEKSIRGGHPWLFADSVREQNRDGEVGELSVIFDRKDKFLAVGLYDSLSPIRVRILHVGKPTQVDVSWFKRKLDEALAKRAGLFDENTNGYRCINGESDGWPGLVLDRYADTYVLKIYTAVWLPRLPLVLELLTFAPRLVIRFSRNIQEAAKQFNLTDGQIIRGDAGEKSVVFLENGLRFEADVVRGQKTGFFLDQRENRKEVQSLARGKAVLNAFSFSGGFSVYAAQGGATSVASLDISQHALDSAKRNFALNPQLTCPHETIRADAFDWIRESKRNFDLIVLDPPSLAKRESERAEAMRAYSKLIGSAIDRLNRNGILVAASCSAHVHVDDFFVLARRAAQSSGRKFQELKTTRHAPDHAATFAEADYLKCIYLKF